MKTEIKKTYRWQELNTEIKKKVLISIGKTDFKINFIDKQILESYKFKLNGEIIKN